MISKIIAEVVVMGSSVCLTLSGRYVWSQPGNEAMYIHVCNRTFNMIGVLNFISWKLMEENLFIFSFVPLIC